MVRVAVVEDEELIRTMLRLNLEGEGYGVDTYGDGEHFLLRSREMHYDLLLLDMMLPGVSGEEVLRDLRSRSANTPVLVVTAKRDLTTRVRSLDGGADDYLAKPFEMPELLARIRAVIRRSQGERSIPSHRILRIGDSTIDLGTHTADTGRGEVRLTDREVALIELFSRNPNRVLTRADILEEVWGLDADPTPRTVDNFIVKLRRIFEVRPERARHFVTVRSVGYRYLP